jgi:hypothetical protein
MMNLRLPVRKQGPEGVNEYTLSAKINKLNNITRHEQLLAVTEKPDFEIVEDDST